MGQEPAPEPQGGQEPTPAAEPKPDDTPKGEPQTFDKDYVEQLRKEAAGYRTRAQEAEGKLSEREEADKSELERAQSKHDREKARADAAEAQLLRFVVAKEKEIPAEAVDLLSGTSREELEASADKILALVEAGKGQEPQPDFNGGPREPAPEPQSAERAHDNAVLQLLGLAPPSNSP